VTQPPATPPQPAAERTSGRRNGGTTRNGNGNGNGNGDGVGVLAAGTVPMKDNNLLYAAGDVIVWVGPPSTACPVGFEDPTTIAGGSYACLGWVDTSGYIFKLDETIKDIPAAGVLTPIRSILTGGSKTVQANLLEALNPYVRSLFDDVPIFPIDSSPLMPATTPPVELGANAVSYVIPDPPGDNRYALIFDSHDGTKMMRLYAPYTKVTARGNDQVQQADIEPINLTWTFYPGTIDDGTDPAVTGVAKRFIQYGQDMSAYFTASS
jgi:hypothetical protein